MAFKSFVLLCALSILSSVQQGYCLYADSLNELNKTLGGSLVDARPLAAPCYDQPGGQSCSSITAQLNSSSLGTYRTSHYAGYEMSQGEACMADPTDHCLLDSIDLQPVPNAKCKQGLVAPHYVEVKNFKDVQLAFDHARRTGRKLSIKNSGHDYLTRSSRRGSLALWTRGLKSMKYEPAFTPSGCKDGLAPARAITFGAGVSAEEALTFAHKNGVVISIPSGGTIGISGGWLLNGGHGFLSNSYGLAADRVLQFTVVTPDGEVRKANRCTNKDLFWALRGGGAGFGVVMDSTQLAEVEAPVSSVVLALFNPSIDQKKQFINVLVDNMLGWAQAGWGGTSGTSFMALVNPKVNVSSAETQLAPAVEYVKASGGLAAVQSFDSFFDFYEHIKSLGLEYVTPVGSAVIPTARIVPKKVLQSAKSRADIVSAILDTEAAGLTSAMLISTPLVYGKANSNRKTAMHPVWYDSAMIIASRGLWYPASSLSERKAVVDLVQNATERFRKVAPNGSSYSNEADPWEKDWAEQNWGKHYSELLRLKRNFDPKKLLGCWHCVGWETSMADYECISGLSP
ncbi:FAD-linked oxidoreductase OXR2 [Paramyrothecium foliicola]|nr:FAD-linked oxidoreductase OXR2 [Paramyrothecium foliicola]